MKNQKKKWKLLIIFIWILFLAAASIGCTMLQRARALENTKTELINQAEIVSSQFTELVQTDFDARFILNDRLISEAKAISFVLENYDDIDEANEFLEDVVTTTAVKNLWIFDRDGNVLFGSGDLPEDILAPEDITFLLDSKAYELVESNYNEDEKYWATTYILEDDNNGIVWGVNDQWLVYAEDIFSDSLKDVVEFFAWDHVLQDISIGQDGMVLAVSEIDGSVISYPDSSVKGNPVEDLDIRIAGEKESAGVDQLLEEFSDTGEMKALEIDSVRYYATRMKTDNDLFLLMFPAQAIEKDVYIETIFLMAPLALITGIGVLYAFCLAASDREQSKNDREKKGGRKVSIGKLKVFTLIAVFLLIMLTLYLETHLVFSRMFEYTSTTAEDVLEKSNDTDQMLYELQTWMQKDNLEKCRIARCGVQHAANGKVDRQYVTDLAECLNVIAIYVFDKDGKVTCTNAPYDGYVIDEDSPFHDLLEGKESVVLKPDREEQKDASEESLQEAGVSLIDESNWVEGAIVIAESDIPTVTDKECVDTVFQRTFLKDNTLVMAVNSENMTVQFFAKVDGSLLMSDQYSYVNSQTDAASLGMDENLIQDQYNGEMFAVDNQYFASVRRTDNAFLMVLRPLVFLDTSNLLSILYVSIVALLFFILLIYMTRKSGKVSEEDSLEVDSQESEKKKHKRSAPDNSDDDDDDDMLTLLGRLTNTEKWEFEKRWPSDGKKWKDKNPMEKFSVTVKLICIIVLGLIVAYVAIAGENSILYYSFNGEWNSGINLYSITQCILCILLLVLLKEVIHKVLYLIARAAKSKGETICCLLNSFTGYILFIAGVFLILGILGVNVAALSLTAGVAGVIFGIGCQNIIADILAGIIMAFEGVACVGDFVSYNGNFGTIQSIGVRTTKLKWFSEITIVRNNELRNYIKMPAEETDRVIVSLNIDWLESLKRVESVLEKELPGIQDYLCKKTGDNVRLKYRGVQAMEDSGIKLSFAIYCQGMYYGWTRRLLNRQLLLMCERNGIQIAMPQIVVNERAEGQKDSDVHSESES